MGRITNCKVGGIFILLLSVSIRVATAQETINWNRSAIQDSVTALLVRYQALHNQLGKNTDERVERGFISLFFNNKVQVINDIDIENKTEKISIEDFVIRIGELFPEGLTMNLDLSRLSIDQPRYDRNHRYILRVRVNRWLNGISEGKVFSSSRKIIIRIAFVYEANIPSDFTIYGSEIPPGGQGYLTAGFSPSYGGFINETIRQDERLKLKMGFGYQGGISYIHYFNDLWGIGAGARLSKDCGGVALDRFDAIGGFDPNLKDVFLDYDIWLLELPVFLSLRTDPKKRLGFRLDLGISAGIRIFENMMSTAVNTNNGQKMVGVITDTDWVSLMNRTNLGLLGGIGLKYAVSDRLAILINGGVRRGLSDLDHNVHADFSSSRYTGQYDPLWGAPGKTVSQSIFINLGASVLLNRESN